LKSPSALSSSSSRNFVLLGVAVDLLRLKTISEVTLAEEDEGFMFMFMLMEDEGLFLLFFFGRRKGMRERVWWSRLVEVWGTMMELREEDEEDERVWDLKEGGEEEGGEEREEEDGGVIIGKGKEEETSLPSFSWRQKAHIPPGFFLLGWLMQYCCIDPSLNIVASSSFIASMMNEWMNEWLGFTFKLVSLCWWKGRYDIMKCFLV